jgi:hypothetical protein
MCIWRWHTQNFAHNFNTYIDLFIEMSNFIVNYVKPRVTEIGVAKFVVYIDCFLQVFIPRNIAFVVKFRCAISCCHQVNDSIVAFIPQLCLRHTYLVHNCVPKLIAYVSGAIH